MGWNYFWRRVLIFKHLSFHKILILNWHVTDWGVTYAKPWLTSKIDHFLLKKQCKVLFPSDSKERGRFLIFKHLCFNEIFLLKWYVTVWVVLYAIVKTDTQNWSNFLYISFRFKNKHVDFVFCTKIRLIYGKSWIGNTLQYT